MRKTIKGKRYDTETAEPVLNWRSTYDIGKLWYASETLYRKSTGEYFLHCEGGPDSPYCQPVGDMFASGQQIIPISRYVARLWAQVRLVHTDFYHESDTWQTAYEICTHDLGWDKPDEAYRRYLGHISILDNDLDPEQTLS